MYEKLTWVDPEQKAKTITRKVGGMGYPQRIRLQRRLYAIYIVFFLTFMILCNFKLFFLQNEKGPKKDFFDGRRRLDLTLKEFQVVFVVPDLDISTYPY